MSSSNGLILVDVETGNTLEEVEAEGLDVLLPEYTLGWSLVLDCRIPPYNTQELDKVIEFAEGVRKKYLLFSKDATAIKSLS